MNAQETILTLQLNVYATTANDGTCAVQCMLDHNTDALFQEGQLVVNGTLIERLPILNQVSNVFDLLDDSETKMFNITNNYLKKNYGQSTVRAMQLV